MQKMMEEWNKVWEEHSTMMMNQPAVEKKIIFQEENKYKEEKEINLLDRAKELIEAGLIQEAILCLEAEVQKNGQNAEAWRILG
mmetsp:Transcript_5719/g.9083  ORF Transcript_5719/g.9083 Transcript_5719/m.9083 type:complete len:84 (-) Transcript_5719:1053-1304(-)